MFEQTHRVFCVVAIEVLCNLLGSHLAIAGEMVGFCSEPNYVTNIQDPAIPRGTHVPSNLLISGDYIASAIISTYNGGTSIQSEIIRNPGAYYRIFYNSSASSTTAFPTMQVAVVNNGSGGHDLSITVGDTPGRTTTTVDIGDLEGKWALISISTKNTSEIVLRTAPSTDYAKLNITANVLVTLSDGTTYTGTASGYRQEILAQDVNDIQAIDHYFYSEPTYFYQVSGNNISAAYMSYNTDTNADMTALSRAFQANFSTYTPGDWC